MKNVKVFIASSAELDEDKLQMDLYFSQKNKGYRKRAICFEQRTWRDFPSYLSEEHLQNRYDDYIRQCDIVIFLFHTRLGQYTLRELQVAFEQVKASGGKRPKIYIYAKRDEHGAALLEKLKQYSEQEYGHFCDTYADYNELFHHFDYQLTQLENEGFIRPNPVDLPRTRRFVLLCLLPVVIVAFFLLAYQLWQPVTFRVELKENISTTLPFRGATLTLKYADVVETRELATLQEVVEFEGINRKYAWLDDFTQSFKAKGYMPVDTTLSYTNTCFLSICRNNDAGVLQGVVTDEERQPMADARVQVLGYSAQTEADGSFLIEVPLSQQATSYRLTVMKAGFEIWDYNGVAPSPTEQMRIALRKK